MNLYIVIVLDLKENRTREHAVCTTIMTQLAVQLAGSIKAVVICLPENDLEDRALEFVDWSVQSMSYSKILIK